jgi:hypothetical protein
LRISRAGKPLAVCFRETSPGHPRCRLSWRRHGDRSSFHTRTRDDDERILAALVHAVMRRIHHLHDGITSQQLQGGSFRAYNSQLPFQKHPGTRNEPPLPRPDPWAPGTLARAGLATKCTFPGGVHTSDRRWPVQLSSGQPVDAGEVLASGLIQRGVPSGPARRGTARPCRGALSW